MALSARSIRIASVIYDGARSRWLGVVEFFAPGLAPPLAVPVRLSGPHDIEHARLVRALVHEAERVGIRP